MINLFKFENGTGTDISQFVSDVSLETDIKTVSTTLSFNIIFPLHDDRTPTVPVFIGDVIYMFKDGIEVFRGKVFYNERNSDQGLLEITCFDDAISISKSVITLNVKSKTAEQITKQICNELGVATGNLISTSIPQSFLFNRKNAYSCITESYQGASTQNGKQYYSYMDQGLLNFSEVGAITVPSILSSYRNITSSSFTQNAESVINRVRVYDENENFIDLVEDAESIALLGVFQDIYVKEKDKQALTVAREKLKGISKDIKVSCLGNILYRTGRKVKVVDDGSGLEDSFIITSDTHLFKSDSYITTLTLSHVGGDL